MLRLLAHRLRQFAPAGRRHVIAEFGHHWTKRWPRPSAGIRGRRRCHRVGPRSGHADWQRHGEHPARAAQPSAPGKIGEVAIRHCPWVRFLRFHTPPRFAVKTGQEFTMARVCNSESVLASPPGPAPASVSDTVFRVLAWGDFLSVPWGLAR